MQNTKPSQTIVLISIISVALLACSSPNTALKPDAPAVAETIVQPIQYFIQPGDQLDVKFFYNPEINESVTVRPDGKISLHLSGGQTCAKSQQNRVSLRLLMGKR